MPDSLPDPFYSTPSGSAYLGDSAKLMTALPNSSVNLAFTSPPYALHFKKEYGNADQRDYIEWFLPFAKQIHRVLRDDGSFVIDIGGAWTPSQPTRSLYHFELLLRLCREIGFFLAQEFFWYNPAKLPSPAEWVTVRKIRVKDAVECIWWLSKTPFPKASNQHVLTEYSPDMLRILRKGYKAKSRPSGHIITNKFRDRGGSIPPNILIFGNNDATGSYMSRCKDAGRTPHPARFPIQLPTFFTRFLTTPRDLVLDPFAGSNTTGEAAEREGRRWIAIEQEERYLTDSQFRFESLDRSPVNLSQRHGELCDTPQQESLFGAA
ncbi:MAG TPA: site-specific DNA-methyltransferase [Verrucomicrobiae bacterium]|nr:site-specific DNA-methyltransferase [Verrucomicrobiae bacterium]HVX83977.1 site-specific DNA-methyltransferase [Phycisphaerae bacterium]